MNWKVCGSRWSSSNSKLTYYPGVCLEGLRKTRKNIIQESRSAPRIEPSPYWMRRRKATHSVATLRKVICVCVCVCLWDIKTPWCLVFLKCSPEIFIYLYIITVTIHYLNFIRKTAEFNLNDFILFNINESSLKESDQRMDMYNYCFSVKLK
jgi:hypothetical protein